MKPYYSHSGIEIYHGDCREVLPTLGPVDLVLTDPPYGINIIRGGGRGANGWRDFRADGAWDAIRPGQVVFDEILRIGKAVIVWGGNYFTDFLPPSSQWLVWDKGQRDFSLADCELAWSSQVRAARVYTLPRAAMLAENGLHPTQKPVSLMKWCIGQVTQAQTILDPFMGSGTTLRAAKDLGRRAIGIEIEERYCEIAARRLSQEVFDFAEVA